MSGRFSLTRPQILVANVIAELTAILGRAPTVDELSHELGTCGHGTANHHIAALRERGWLAPRGAIALLATPPAIAVDEGPVAVTPLGRAYLDSRESA